VSSNAALEQASKQASTHHAIGAAKRTQNQPQSKRERSRPMEGTIKLGRLLILSLSGVFEATQTSTVQSKARSNLAA